MDNKFESRAFKTTLYFNDKEIDMDELIELFSKEGIRVTSAGGVDTKSKKNIEASTASNLPVRKTYLELQAGEQRVRQALLESKFKDKIEHLSSYGSN